MDYLIYGNELTQKQIIGGLIGFKGIILLTLNSKHPE
jgi:hypothetical protein